MNLSRYPSTALTTPDALEKLSMLLPSPAVPRSKGYKTRALFSISEESDMQLPPKDTTSSPPGPLTWTRSQALTGELCEKSGVFRVRQAMISSTTSP